MDSLFISALLSNSVPTFERKVHNHFSGVEGDCYSYRINLHDDVWVEVEAIIWVDNPEEDYPTYELQGLTVHDPRAAQ